jgi:hypothetical protein
VSYILVKIRYVYRSTHESEAYPPPHRWDPESLSILP